MSTQDDAIMCLQCHCSERRKYSLLPDWSRADVQAAYRSGPTAWRQRCDVM